MRALIRPTLVVAIAIVCLSALSATATAAGPNNDPIEPVNRAIFWFNDKVDVYALEPVASGWNKIAPDRVKHCLSNFFQNLRFPVVAANNLLQGKVVPTISDALRFMVNTTVGVGGFFDPASRWGMAQHYEDFGQTLGYWGVPPGPYLVLPFFGPSDPRDAVGLAADSFSTVYPFFVEFAYTFSARSVDLVNARAAVLREVRQAKDTSFDYYSFVRNAYQQRRTALVNDSYQKSDKEEEDLYLIDTNDGETP